MDRFIHIAVHQYIFLTIGNSLYMMYLWLTPLSSGLITLVVFDAKKNQGILFIKTWKYAQQYLVFDMYYLQSKSCYNLFMI